MLSLTLSLVNRSARYFAGCTSTGGRDGWLFVTVASLIRLLAPARVSFYLRTGFASKSLSSLLLIHNRMVRICRYHGNRIVLRSHRILTSHVLSVHEVAHDNFSRLLLTFYGFRFSVIRCGQRLQRFSAISLRYFTQRTRGSQLLIHDSFRRTSLITRSRIKHFTTIHINSSRITFVSLRTRSR